MLDLPPPLMFRSHTQKPVLYYVFLFLLMFFRYWNRSPNSSLGIWPSMYNARLSSIVATVRSASDHRCTAQVELDVKTDVKRSRYHAVLGMHALLLKVAYGRIKNSLGCVDQLPVVTFGSEENGSRRSAGTWLLAVGDWSKGGAQSTAHINTSVLLLCAMGWFTTENYTPAKVHAVFIFL